MLSNYADLIQKCCPITIANDDHMTGARIGGVPPQGIEPPVILDTTRYFATLPFRDIGLREMSIYLSTVYKLDSPVSMLTNRSILFTVENPMVQIVIHKPASRGEDFDLSSELTGRGLIIEDERPDSGDLDIIWNHHKIGGHPFFRDFDDPIAAQGKDLLKEGYLHLVQFAFPDKKDGRICGTWPFAEYIFHVFAKDVDGRIDFRYCWG